ncbi:hypothetical protein [Acinetobacter soli]|uniref:hypothetical protein n=1 Tax=Acinetobacter soli TaxID=487316 RepID=UPI002090D97F|nr:hypothetical protein [Acinetobacter soli]
MTNLTEVQNEDNHEFLIGDVVVLSNPFYTSDSNEIFEVKYIYGNGDIRITTGFQGKTVTSQEIRHASVAELNANRRLSGAEMALGEVP